MGSRLAGLILAALLVQGCVRAGTASESPEGCGSCHAKHYTKAGACDDCHRGQPASARKELAHARLLSGRAAEYGLTNGTAVQEGRLLVEAAACRRCHTIGGLGNNLATNLDSVAWRREQQELMTSIMEPVESMPVFKFDPKQAEAVIAFVLNVGKVGASEEAYRVQFVRDGSRAPSTFDEKCGGCHRLLTQNGPLGARRSGPNLSGLLTPFYPQTAAGQSAWSEKALADWVANPRAMRSGTVMPPVSLSAAELQQVLESIRASSSMTTKARR